MEEMKTLVKRIEANHNDLDAWQRLGELVDDPQKKNDCRNQVTRIQNERYGVFHPILCKHCSTLMQVVSASDGRPVTASCPACHQTVVVGASGQPAVETRRTGSRSKDESKGIALLKGQLTLFAIIASNLLPIFGILFLGWSMGSVMIIYWLENVIVGLFALLKMAFAQGQAGTGMGKMTRIPSFRISFIPSSVENVLTKLTVLPFFCVHFGLFCLVHGVFVLALFLPKGLTSGQWLNLLAGLTVPFIGMLISHSTYFVQHYLMSGTYKYASLNVLMLEPYARIVPMHVGLIAAGFFIVTVGSPMAVVVILVLLKTGGEVVAYRNSMKRWRPRVA